MTKREQLVAEIVELRKQKPLPKDRLRRLARQIEKMDAWNKPAYKKPPPTF